MLADTYPVQAICRTLDWARSSYYYRRDDEDDAELRAAIQELAGQWPTYGYRRITAHLQRAGWSVNHKRVQRLMGEMGLKGKAPKRKVRTTDSTHGHERYPNRVQNLAVTAPEQVWVAEIVCTQMTKTHDFAVKTGGNGVSNLNRAVRHHNPVNQELDQLTFLLKGRIV